MYKIRGHLGVVVVLSVLVLVVVGAVALVQDSPWWLVPIVLILGLAATGFNRGFKRGAGRHL